MLRPNLTSDEDARQSSIFSPLLDVGWLLVCENKISKIDNFYEYSSKEIYSTFFVKEVLHDNLKSTSFFLYTVALGLR